VIKLKWKLQEQPDPTDLERLCKVVPELEPSIWTLLWQRGIHSFEAVRDFMRPGLHQLHNPFLMKDMDKATHRLNAAIERGERVMVYGDYDVDGTTSVALVYSFLASKGVDCTYYIPDRFEEGYGFSMKGVEFAHEQRYSLIITLDCGIKDAQRIEKANELGIDVIICDHHNVETLPPAFAVLDPKRPDCAYPDKGLSGCGVGFKLLQGLCEVRGESTDELFRSLDLLAISIGADIVPLVGENRALASEGLRVLQTDRRPGIVRMLNLANVKKEILDISDVVFILAPRINAAGRIKSGRDAVRLLISQDPEEIEEMGKLLESNNLTRRGLDKSITESAIAQIEEDSFYKSAFSLVVKGEEWSKGVVGIVASRLVEAYFKPAIVLTTKGDQLAGSARSVPGLDLYEALGACEDLLTQFGGHTMAAGLSLPVANFTAFRKRFDQVVAEALCHTYPVPEVRVDMELDFSAIKERFFNQLKLFAPFGPQNMKPVFMSLGVVNAGGTRAVGGDLTHLKVHLRHPDHPHSLDGIAFGMAKEWADPIREGRPVDILYTLAENEWNGRKTIQLEVQDIRASETSDVFSQNDHSSVEA